MEYKYVIIEQAEEDYEAYITYLKDEKEIENYECVGLGNFVCLNINAFNNLCLKGVGA